LKRGSAANRLGFRVGDIVRAVNRVKVDNIAGLRPSATGARRSGRVVTSARADNFLGQP